jgi:hypothetical protein
VPLQAELERVAALARRQAGDDALVAVLATEPAVGARRYLCAFERDGTRTWLVVDDDGSPLTDPAAVRESVAIAALCELAEESAFPGDIDELRAQLVALRVSENPPGIDEAEAAALALQHVLAAPPTIASPERLDGIGLAARRLERALDPAVTSPFGAAMQSAPAVVEELVREVVRGYRLPLGTP